MSTQTAKGSGSTVNDGGTIVQAGAKASDSRITDELTYTRINYAGANYGQKIAGPDTDAIIALGNGSHPAGASQNFLKNTYKPNSGGTFAYVMGDREFLVMNLEKKVSGVASTLLMYSCADFPTCRRSINRRETTRTLIQRTWNWVTGSAGTATVHTDFAGVTGVSSQDHAARPSAALPGELVYLETGYTPEQDDYPATYLW